MSLEIIWMNQAGSLTQGQGQGQEEHDQGSGCSHLFPFMAELMN
jgi:hypothetical protein